MLFPSSTLPYGRPYGNPRLLHVVTRRAKMLRVSKPHEQAFTIEVDGIARNLFITYERKDGTVVLNPLRKGSQFSQRLECHSSMPFTPPLGAHQLDVAVKQSRYSIHPSDESTDEVNLIKLTHTYENEEEITSVHYTAAIKRTNMFAPILNRRFDDVRSACYDLVPSKTKRVKLDDSKPLFTPVVGVFVGASGRRFDCPLQGDFQFKEVEFTRFTFMFMWSFILLAPRRGHDIHTRTIPEMEPHTFTSDAECVGYFKLQRELLKREFICRAVRTRGLKEPVFVERVDDLADSLCGVLHDGDVVLTMGAGHILVQSWSFDPNARVAIEMTKSAGYFREARTDTPEFRAFTARLHAMSQPIMIFR